MKLVIGQSVIEFEKRQVLYVVSVDEQTVGLAYRVGGPRAVSPTRRDFSRFFTPCKIHRRYLDTPDRPDLRALAKCNNINGAVFPASQLTSDDHAVTCGTCRRISRT